MPRVRADDYDDKTRSIMDAAAALFARIGYPSAKMQDIAKSCGASKSMLYHYFPTKDDLLFGMLKEHLEELIDGIESLRESTRDPRERFLAFVQLYVQRSAQARRRHVVAMNDVKYLPKSRQTPLLELEGTVVTLASDFLKELNPHLDATLYKPYTMMLIGMLNWTEIWYRPNGPMKAQELCDRITRLFLVGFLAEKSRSPGAVPARGMSIPVS
jgi:AcrR family transcriptional regulator